MLENPTYDFPGFFSMHFRGSVSVLCSSKAVVIYTLHMVLYRSHTLVSQIAQHVPTESSDLLQVESLAALKGKEPALTGSPRTEGRYRQ